VKRHSEHDAAEARRNVVRMHEQSEKLLTGSQGDTDDDDNDPVVILGKRIGRGLGLVVGAGLLVYLMATYLGH
jgi:hypothetical protein